jgi:tRNA dimethylallyltransferase
MRSVLAIVGATATGKSALAVELAERLGGEIVNADALQLYRGLDIGTAKPGAEERARVPHHLLDVLDPREQASAGEFARRARAALNGIARRGRTAIVVGGSGLYQRALWSGLAQLPPVDAAVRGELDRRLASEGLPALRRELEELDPATAARLAPRDRQRTLRALEVARATGRPLSSWIAERPPRPAVAVPTRIGLTLPRSVLYDRIASRVEEMARRGWLEEVRALLASGVDRACPAFQAIGYAQWIRHLDGEIDRAAALREITAATRRYAKRQETWFRRETDIVWRDARDAGDVLRELAGSLSD